MKVFFDYTNQCNAQCLYCFTNSGNFEEKELTLNDIKSILNILIEKGVQNVSIGGGEPFLKYFCEICDYINGRMEISVTTNGSILSPSIIERLEKYNIKVTVSLDTINEHHFSLIRKGNNLQSVLTNLDRLLDNDVIKENLSIRAVVTTTTINDLEELIDYCVLKKIKRLKINSTNYYGRAKENESIIPDFSIFMKRLNELKKFYTDSKREIELELPIKKYLGKGNELCTLGKTSCYIDSQGDIYPCAFSEKKLKVGNMLTDKPEDVFKNLEKFSHNNSVCNICAINRYSKYY